MKSSQIKAKESIYNISMQDIDGNEFALELFKGHYLLIVNVASECGYTPQYAELQELYTKYEGRLIVLGVPCNDFGGQEPGDEKQIRFFCTENYDVTFPLTSKVHITGEAIHPLYRWLSDPTMNGWNSELPGWNFCKYLIDPDGNLTGYYTQLTSPMSSDITDKLK